MVHELIDPRDTPERQNQKLLKIVETLMRRAEQSSDASGEAYAQFQRAVMLEEEVRVRTRELEHALDLLNESNARLALANAETEAARANLANAIETVQEGFALFDAQDVLVMCNTRFGKHMADIYHLLRPGLDFKRLRQTNRKEMRESWYVDHQKAKVFAMLSDPPAAADAMPLVLSAGLAIASGVVHRPISLLYRLFHAWWWPALEQPACTSTGAL